MKKRVKKRKKKDSVNCLILYNILRKWDEEDEKDDEMNVTINY